MAHVQVVRLFRRVERKKRRAMDRWLSVGRRLASIIYTRACFLLDTSARKSATKEAIQQAEQCLKDWDTLETSGLTKNGSFIDGIDFRRACPLHRATGLWVYLLTEAVCIGLSC
jgi:hypothetical protein